MPNWCMTTIEVDIPKENKDKFLGFFLDWNAETYPKDERKFYRSFLDGADCKDIGNGRVDLVIDCSCAWSAESCLISPPSRGKEPEFAKLVDILRECDAGHMKLYSEEPGCCFIESATYEKEKDEYGILYECFDMFTGRRTKESDREEDMER